MLQSMNYKGLRKCTGMFLVTSVNRQLFLHTTFAICNIVGQMCKTWTKERGLTWKFNRLQQPIFVNMRRSGNEHRGDQLGDTDGKKPIVYKRYEDGYIVRQMLPEDTKTLRDWFATIEIVSRCDLDITLSCFPKDCEGFYIGEYEGKVVASAVRIPWGNVFYGSYYYVEEAYRGRGFGIRIWEEVSRNYVGKNTCCIDAIIGSPVETKFERFGYIMGYKIGHYHATAKRKVVQYCGEIKKATDVSFEDLIEYDNKNFICPNVKERREFLKKWIVLPGGAAFVALDKAGQIVGLGCRRPCIQEKTHNIGPLYADSLEIGNGLMQRLMDDIEGENADMNICDTNQDALKMAELFGFERNEEFQRMYLNADPGVPKNSTLAVTSLEVCGY